MLLEAATRLLVLAPHPDDETIAAGGLIQQVREAGGEVRIVQVTDGDNNPWPQRWLERRVRIDANARQRWGRRRRQEAEHAARQLGVAGPALHALGWPDGELTSELQREHAAMLAAMHRELDTYRPNLVVLPSLADRHPDHGSLHVLMRLALHAQAGRPQVLAYLVHGEAVPGTQWLDVPMPTELQANKLVALDAYRTQMALSGGRMRALASRPERYEVVDPTRAKAEPILPWRPAAWLRPWLRLMLVDSAGAHDWRWRDAPLQREADGSWRLLAPRVEGPRFVRLHLELPSPWIFDHWGWREL